MRTYIALAFGLAFLVAPKSTQAAESFRAIGKVIESADDHTTKHNHELRFFNLKTGETVDIVDSPELLREHCKTGQSPVVEVEGYRTDRFLFWGNNLVVKNFRVHDDIPVAPVAHKVERQKVNYLNKGSRL